jgi:hypothetical protein
MAVEGIVPDHTHKMLVQVSTILMIIVAAMTIYNFMQVRKAEKLNQQHLA